MWAVRQQNVEKVKRCEYFSEATVNISVLSHSGLGCALPSQVLHRGKHYITHTQLNGFTGLQSH